MRATDFLKQVGKIDRMIANKLEEIERWHTLATLTTASMMGDRVQASSSQQKMADATVECVAIEQDLQRDIKRLQKTLREVTEVIEQLDENQYDVLHKAYIQGLTLQQIADLQGKTRSGVSNIHRKAIKNVQAILDRGRYGRAEKNSEI